jgi:hypothetical protein
MALIPVAAKRIARRSPDAGRMVEFVGGPHAPDAAPDGHLETLRGLLGQYRGVASAESLSATSRYLDLVADVL